MDFPAELSISASCLPAGRCADHGAGASRTAADAFAGAARQRVGFVSPYGFHLSFYVEIGKKMGLFMMKAYDMDIWMEMSLLAMSCYR